MPKRRLKGKGRLLTRLLAVHAVSIGLFLLARAAMSADRPARFMVDVYLGMGGFVFGLLAVAASLTAVGIVTAQPERRTEWPWLIVHLAAVAAVIALARAWMSSHA